MAPRIPWASPEKLQTEFISFATKMSGSQYLQFSKLQQIELFERRSSQKIFWNKLSLPDLVVAIRVPVEYTYYLDLDATWKIVRHPNNIVEVHAPDIQFNTPAVDLSQIKYEVKKDSVFRNSDQALLELQRGIMDMARDRASENIHLVRELGRRQTQEFIGRWIKQNDPDLQVTAVRVLFSDEYAKKPQI